MLVVVVVVVVVVVLLVVVEELGNAGTSLARLEDIGIHPGVINGPMGLRVAGVGFNEDGTTKGYSIG